MKAALVTGLEEVSIQELAVPCIGSEEVLIRVRAVGVCGSDLHLFRGTHAFRKPPAILGHEVTGDVVDVGANVRSLKLGDRVIVEPQYGCGTCEFCTQGTVNLCASKIVPGTPKWMGVFVEYWNAPEKTVHKLGDHVGYALGTLIEPLAVAVRTLRNAHADKKGALLILGAGTIGLLCLVLAKKMGYQTVICTDTVAFNRAVALEYGATAALDPFSDDVVAAVMALTNGTGADLAIVAAGAGNILDQASAAVKKQGEIGIVAMITEAIPFHSYGIVFKEQRMYGAMAYSSDDFREALRLVNEGLDLSGLITQILPLEKTQEALSLLHHKKENVVKVVIAF